MRPRDLFVSDIDPFEDKTPSDLSQLATQLIQQGHLHWCECDIHRGALLAQDPTAFTKWKPQKRTVTSEAPSHDTIFEDEKKCLEKELPVAPTNGKIWSEIWDALKVYFSQPWRIHALVGCCYVGAIIQGWDETGVNGAQLIYHDKLRVPSEAVLGLINSAPYLMSFFTSLLLTEPLNSFLGRRGTILFTCFFSFASCLGQAFVQTWQQLLVCRLLLGFGIGPKTATIPIYAAECVPERIRGALVSQWQLWDAFGILAGLVTSNIFQHSGASWRIMLGSPAFKIIPAATLFFLMLSMPESPRWHLLRAYFKYGSDKEIARFAHYESAFNSLRFLRRTRIQAARDLVVLDTWIGQEIRSDVTLEKQGESSYPTYTYTTFFGAFLAKFQKLFRNPRCQTALVASLIIMISQQLCGINVLAYYSTPIFFEPTDDTGGKHCIATFDVLTTDAPGKAASGQSFDYSIAIGALNFGLTIPALFLIDTIGRRKLLLYTFPLMALSYLAAGLSYLEHNCGVQKTLIRAFCYIFVVWYSLGEGPVPLVYASESFPVIVRDTGIGFVTAIYWLFNFVLAMSWPKFYDDHPYRHGIAFGFYGVMCIIAFILMYLFVPETKQQTLEELDAVFSKGFRKAWKREEDRESDRS